MHGMNSGMSSMTLISSEYLTANVPYVHLLLEYRPQFYVLFAPSDDPKFLGYEELIPESMPCISKTLYILGKMKTVIKETISIKPV
jgi:hypothetical protein